MEVTRLFRRHCLQCRVRAVVVGSPQHNTSLPPPHHPPRTRCSCILWCTYSPGLRSLTSPHTVHHRTWHWTTPSHHHTTPTVPSPGPPTTSFHTLSIADWTRPSPPRFVWPGPSTPSFPAIFASPKYRPTRTQIQSIPPTSRLP